MHKHLVSPKEKATILAAMRAKVMSARYWSAVFKRLPDTIVKFAQQENIKLANV